MATHALSQPGGMRCDHIPWHAADDVPMRNQGTPVLVSQHTHTHTQMAAYLDGADMALCTCAGPVPVVPMMSRPPSHNSLALARLCSLPAARNRELIAAGPGLWRLILCHSLLELERPSPQPDMLSHPEPVVCKGAETGAGLASDIDWHGCFHKTGYLPQRDWRCVQTSGVVAGQSAPPDSSFQGCTAIRA